MAPKIRFSDIYITFASQNHSLKPTIHSKTMTKSGKLVRRSHGEARGQKASFTGRWESEKKTLA
jgi:hypothetical protein